MVDVIVAALEAEPGVWQTSIGQDLRDTGAATDEQVLAAARELLALAGAAGSQTFRVDASHAKGLQVGDHNTQTDTFN
ncbi:hypothetical protein ACIBSW_31945 [Actinoplanes sp. NPDC049668]|uniref:hypothetical protein n=1 Tax=unclassified Actinoplanes TaxID=2626549 RepID=UPI0033A37472